MGVANEPAIITQKLKRRDFDELSRETHEQGVRRICLDGRFSTSVPKSKCQKNECHALNQEEYSKNNWDR
jgi:hypothetical protein